MSPNRRVSRGAVGGASGDAGVEYRRAVAAYAAACGLAGVNVPGLEIPEPDALVDVVALETENAVDDIEISFTTGWTASIQAKRSLRRGTSLTKAVAQWVTAGKAGVDPTRQRLVVASGNLSGPMKHLRTALNRRRFVPAGPPTEDEADIFDHVAELLSELTPSQRSAVLDAAVIWEIAAEEPEHPGAREAISYLRASGYSIEAERVTAVWAELRAAAGRLARNRAGANLQGWLLELRKGGIVVDQPGNNPAGELERRRVALGHYYERLARESREIDLRALGARLPPLPIAGADAVVKVRTDPEDERDTADLIWAFLRLGRVVVTALPGGGKSTAVRRLAGDLAIRRHRSLDGGVDGTSYPFPVRASLRDINAYPDITSFRDRVIRAATRDDSSADREILRREIEHRLDDDRPIALLLDALDETYEDRASVVATLDTFLQSVPAGVCVLVATRDVAYGDAATLGWHDLRLLPPEEPSAPVGPLLAAAAEHLGVGSSDRDRWIGQREAWVDSILSRERSLAETPLTPVLLAILAIERDFELLPQTRSAALRDIVTTVVSRRELRRQDGQALGPLSGSDLDSAATRAFAAEGSTLLDHGGIAPVEAATQAIAGTLADHWGLPAGHAESAGRDAVRLFDETGLFVINHAASTISSRLTLFAEIADAVNAIRNATTISDWVARRVAADVVEPVVLAATLDQAAHKAFETAFKADRERPSLVRGAIQIHKDGTELSNDVLRILREQMIAAIRDGTREGWKSWHTLLEIGLPADLGHAAVEAASAHSPEHAVLVQAFLDLKYRSGDDIKADPGAVLDVLQFARLPSSPHSDSTSRVTAGQDSWFYELGGSAALNDVQVPAAEILINHEAEVIDLIAEIVGDTSRGNQKRLLALLTDNGHGDVVKRLRDEQSSALPNLDWVTNFDDTRYGRFLDLLAEGPQQELTTGQAVRLNDLGDFLEMLGLNAAGSQHFYKQPDDYLKSVAGVAATLFGFDIGVVASQAQVARARMNAEESDGNDGFASYFSLFKFVNQRTTNDWSDVRDVEKTVDLVLPMFWQGRRQAAVAMKMLWNAQRAKDYAAPLLRELLVKVRSSPAHQRMVAITLVTLKVRPEPDNWVSSEDPVLRAVAARTVKAFKGGNLNPQFSKLLFDVDGHVREMAIDNISGTSGSTVDALLAKVAKSRPGWMCLSCRTVNSNGLSTACSKDGCLRSGPRPDEKAAKVLAQRIEA